MPWGQCQLVIIIGALFLFVYLHLTWMISRIVSERRTMKSSRESSVVFTEVLIADESGAERPEGRLFCWIMTSQRYNLERAKYLQDTWPPRCDGHFFFTDDNSGQDPSRFINVFQGINDSYGNLWAKTQAALRYIDKHLAEDFDWFLKADDDTYVIVENLREFLSRFNKSTHHYSGHRLKYELVHGHNSGGAGYILSRSTVKLLVQLLPNKTMCPGGWAEDKEVARCLENAGIYPTDTLDDKKRDKFIHMHPAHYMYQLLGVTAKELISPEVISLHQLQPAEYRLLDFFLYHVRRANRKA